MVNRDYTLLFADGLHLSSNFRGFVNGYFIKRVNTAYNKQININIELVKIPIPIHYFNTINLKRGFGVYFYHNTPFFHILKNYSKQLIYLYTFLFKNISLLIEKKKPKNSYEEFEFYRFTEMDLFYSEMWNFPINLSLSKYKLEYKYLKNLREIRCLFNLTNSFPNLNYSYMVIFTKKFCWSQIEKRIFYYKLKYIRTEGNKNENFHINFYIPIFTLYQSFIFFFKFIQEWLMIDFLFFGKDDIKKEIEKIVRKGSKFSKFELAFLDFILNNKHIYKTFEKIFNKIVLSKDKLIKLEPFSIENIDFPVWITGTIINHGSIKNKFDYANVLVTRLRPIWELFINWDDIKYLTYPEKYRIRKLKEKFEKEDFFK